MCLFCRILSLVQDSFAKKTYVFREPTNRSQPISNLNERNFGRGTLIKCCTRFLWIKCRVSFFWRFDNTTTSTMECERHLWGAHRWITRRSWCIKCRVWFFLDVSCRHTLNNGVSSLREREIYASPPFSAWETSREGTSMNKETLLEH